MAFNRPTLTEIIDRARQDIASRVTGETSILRRSVLGVVARVLAGMSHMLHGHIDWAAKQLLPDTAEEEYLARHASIYGVGRKPAAFASGSVTFSGSNGSTIPAGTIIQRADEVQYRTEEDATISGGSVTATVTAVLAGIDGNADAGISVSFLSPVGGVNSTGIVAAGGIINGADAEKDTPLRERLLDRIRRPPQGGADYDYVNWAKEVPAVTRAWVYPNNQGVGTVGVTFVTDSDPGGVIPNASKVQEVQDYIDARRPVTANVTVFAPVEEPLDFNITINPSTQAVKDAVEAELRDLLLREAEPNGTILLSHIREAVSVAAGETDNTVNSPTADVTHSEGKFPTFGGITWD